MRRLTGLVLAGAIVMMPVLSQSALAQQPQAQPPQQAAPQQQQQTAAPPQKTTYMGDMVIAAYAVNADKVADYEKVLAMLKESLGKIERPEAKEQLAGWKIIRAATPQPDGSLVFLHVISPVVPDADYSITNLVYETVTDPQARIDFYNLYRGALKQPVFLIQGAMVSDFSK